MLPSNAPDWETVNPPPKRGPRVTGGFIFTIVLALALVAVIAVAITQLSGVRLSRPTASAAATPVAPATQDVSVAGAGSVGAQAAGTDAGVPADSSTQQTIQQVIQQVDAAQVQALETNNPSVMAATATPEFYREQVANNQDMIDNGVTDIKLIKLEWGPITVNGNTATATVWETWITTFDDGTTEQSRDRNVYTLVLDNTGTWVVQADDHPDQTVTTVPTPAP